MKNGNINVTRNFLGDILALRQTTPSRNFARDAQNPKCTRGQRALPQFRKKKIVSYLIQVLVEHPANINISTDAVCGFHSLTVPDERGDRSHNGP